MLDNFWKIDILLFLKLGLIFIFMTIIGTVSHEFGHYSLAKMLGYEASINYKSSSNWNPESSSFAKITYEKYGYEIEHGLDYPNKEEYENTAVKQYKDGFWITLGGPTQSILTGTIGLCLLIYYRKKITCSEKVTTFGWVLIFMTLFWLRQLANLGVGILYFIKNGHASTGGDEARLAQYLNWNIWSIEISTGLIAFIILLYISSIIPKSQRSTFLLAGIVGGVSGYYLWLEKFGMFIMP